MLDSNDPHIQPSTFAQRAGLMNTAQKQVHIACPIKQKSQGESNKFIPNDEDSFTQENPFASRLSEGLAEVATVDAGAISKKRVVLEY